MVNIATRLKPYGWRLFSSVLAAAWTAARDMLAALGNFQTALSLLQSMGVRQMTIEHWISSPHWFLSPYITIPTGLIWLAFTWRTLTIRILATRWAQLFLSFVQVPVELDFRQKYSRPAEIENPILQNLYGSGLSAGTLYDCILKNSSVIWPMRHLRIYLNHIDQETPLANELPFRLSKAGSQETEFKLNPSERVRIRLVHITEAKEVVFSAEGSRDIPLANADLNTNAAWELWARLQSAPTRFTLAAYDGIWIPKKFTFSVQYDQSGEPIIKRSFSSRKLPKLYPFRLN